MLIAFLIRQIKFLQQFLYNYNLIYLNQFNATNFHYITDNMEIYQHKIYVRKA